MPVRLERPSREVLASYFEFIDEMRVLAETIWPSRVPEVGEAPGAFLERLLSKELAAEPPRVPESVYWGVEDGGVVGVIALRHRLNARLAQYGGHIGYEVRPSARRRGVATEMLKLVLETDRAKSIGRILVTCAPSNTASRRAIEKNRGVLSGIVFVDEVQRETSQYWIDLAVKGEGERP